MTDDFSLDEIPALRRGRPAGPIGSAQDKYLVVPDGRTVLRSERTAEMIELFKSGYTLTEIGVQYAITRERVRQLVRRHCGKEGCGMSIRSAARRKAVAKVRQEKREARILRTRGMSAEQWDQLRRKYPNEWRWFFKAFTNQRNAAGRDKHPWRLTFAQWFSIWEASGKLAERGRGDGYVLGRIDQAGPFEMGNLAIRTQSENAALKFQPPRNFVLPHVAKAKRRTRAGSISLGDL